MLGVLTVLAVAAAAGSPAPQGEAGHLRPPRAVAIREAVEWLVADQRADGAWGSHHSPRPIEVLCSVPGGHQVFRVATTALCVMALDGSPYWTEASRAAADRGIDSILAEHEVTRANALEHYTPWALGFGLQCLSERLLARPDDARAAEMRRVCERLIEKLGIYQDLDGGWGYLSLQEVKTFRPSFTSMSFTTATCLIGLERARQAGFAIPPEMLERAVESVDRCETAMRSFTYGELWRKWRPNAPSVNHPKAAACRGPVCLESLALFGRARKEVDHLRALEWLLVDHASFQVASLRRPIPHESHYAVSGYFYLYGHYYASLLQRRVSDTDRRRYAPYLENAVNVCRQPDGSYWDYPLYSYHQPYGTAFALLTLTEIERFSGSDVGFPAQADAPRRVRNVMSDPETGPIRVEAAGRPIDLEEDGGYAGPGVHDLDGDGRLDLLAGSYDGRILFFRNTGGGRDGTPELAAGQPLEAEGEEIRISNW